MTIHFAPATRRGTRARIALIGPAKSGKTYTALQLATGLGGRIALLDTENRSASKYADGQPFHFDECPIYEYSIDTYIAAIDAAERQGYDVLVIDSLSHSWMGRGGALEMVDKAAARMQSHNSFAAWKHVTPKFRGLIDRIINCRCHVICTMRAKTEWVLDVDSRGKTVPRKVGLAPVIRDGIEYEFDIVGDIDAEHQLIISGSRCTELADAVIPLAGPEVGATIAAWLEGATPAAPSTAGEGEQTARPAPHVHGARVAAREEMRAAAAGWAAALVERGGAATEAAALGAIRERLRETCEEPYTAEHVGQVGSALVSEAVAAAGTDTAALGDTPANHAAAWGAWISEVAGEAGIDEDRAELAIARARDLLGRESPAVVLPRAIAIAREWLEAEAAA